MKVPSFILNVNDKMPLQVLNILQFKGSNIWRHFHCTKSYYAKSRHNTHVFYVIEYDVFS